MGDFETGFGVDLEEMGGSYAHFVVGWKGEACVGSESQRQLGSIVPIFGLYTYRPDGQRGVSRQSTIVANSKVFHDSG